MVKLISNVQISFNIYSQAYSLAIIGRYKLPTQNK